MHASIPPAAAGPESLAGAHTRRLMALRALSVLVMAGATLALPLLLAVRVPEAALLSVLLGLAASIPFTLAWMARPGAPVPAALPFAQLLVDLVAWSLFLYFAGGATNPLISLLLPLVAIGAAILPAGQAAALAALAIGAYTLLWRHYHPLHIDDEALAMRWHLGGMWLTFALSAAVIVGFVVRLNAVLRARDAELAAANEAMARDERVVALGNLAAGAAHSLGTPLGTMRILVDELRGEAPSAERLRDDLALLSAQIDQCRLILARLTAEAGNARAEGGRVVDAAQWLRDTVAQWQARRPGIRVDLRCDDVAGTGLVADATLSQALETLVNNAADAQPPDAAEPIVVAALHTDNRLVVEVRDRGHGMDAAQRASAGESPRPGAGAGMGIGLFLARRALARCGGALAFDARDNGGTVARLTLPLDRLAP